MVAKKSVSVTLNGKQEKKSVTRFVNSTDDDILSNAYVGKKAVEQLGNPGKIKVTIEAA